MQLWGVADIAAMHLGVAGGLLPDCSFPISGSRLAGMSVAAQRSLGEAGVSW